VLSLLQPAATSAPSPTQPIADALPRGAGFRAKAAKAERKKAGILHALGAVVELPEAPAKAKPKGKAKPAKAEAAHTMCAAVADMAKLHREIVRATTEPRRPFPSSLQPLLYSDHRLRRPRATSWGWHLARVQFDGDGARRLAGKLRQDRP